jgi:ABC-type cobalamin/Fe3+-siderophores transport system ATPase subunit
MLHSVDKSILLLDEPTSHIDGASQKTALDNLFALARENNQTVLMVAHRLDTAVTFCDKVLVLDGGEVA